MVPRTLSSFVVLYGRRVSLIPTIQTRTKAGVFTHTVPLLVQMARRFFLVWACPALQFHHKTWATFTVTPPPPSRPLCTHTQTSTYTLMFRTMNYFPFFKDASTSPPHPQAALFTDTSHITPTGSISRLLLVFLDELAVHFLWYFCPALPSQSVLPSINEVIKLYYCFLVKTNCTFLLDSKFCQDERGDPFSLS